MSKMTIYVSQQMIDKASPEEYNKLIKENDVKIIRVDGTFKNQYTFKN